MNHLHLAIQDSKKHRGMAALKNRQNFEKWAKAIYQYADAGKRAEIKKQDVIRHVSEVVSTYYNLTIEEMRNHKRTRPIVKARQIAMFLIRWVTEKIPLREIGEAFGGKDHTTVIHSCQTVKNLMHTDREYRFEIEKLQRLI